MKPYVTYCPIWVVLYHREGDLYGVVRCTSSYAATCIVDHNKYYKRHCLIVRVKSVK